MENIHKENKDRTIFNEITNTVLTTETKTEEWKRKNNFRTADKSCLTCKYLEYDTYSHSYSCTKLKRETGYGYLGMIESTVQATICDKYKNERRANDKR